MDQNRLKLCYGDPNHLDSRCNGGTDRLPENNTEMELGNKTADHAVQPGVTIGGSQWCSTTDEEVQTDDRNQSRLVKSDVKAQENVPTEDLEVKPLQRSQHNYQPQRVIRILFLT